MICANEEVSQIAAFAQGRRTDPRCPLSRPPVSRVDPGLLKLLKPRPNDQTCSLYTQYINYLDAHSKLLRSHEINTSGLDCRWQISKKAVRSTALSSSRAASLAPMPVTIMAEEGTRSRVVGTIALNARRAVHVAAHGGISVAGAERNRCLGA